MASGDIGDLLFRQWRREEILNQVDHRLHPMPDAWWASVLEQGPPQDVDWEGLRSE